MSFNSDRVKAGIHTGLVLAASYFTEKMKAKIIQVNAPRKIIDATSIGSPVITGEGAGYIDITIDTPVAAAFEYGSGLHGKKGERYPIEPKNAKVLAFPWSIARNLSPSFTGKSTAGIELSADDKAFLPKVMHPGVAARPFIRPTIQEEREQIKKILGKEFIASIKLGGITTIIK